MTFWKVVGAVIVGMVIMNLAGFAFTKLQG
jgi:hypothetical protein